MTKIINIRIMGLLLLFLFLMLLTHLLEAVAWKASGPFVAEAQSEKLYRLAIFEDITSTNTLSIYGPNSTVWNSYARTGLGVHASLFTLADKTFQFVPSAAEADTDKDLATAQALTPRSDGKFETIIKIRKGQKWSDGRELTADDLVFSYNAPLELGPQQMGGNWPAIIDTNFLERAEKIDAYTIRLVLKRMPGIARWQYGLLGAPIFQKAYWEPKFAAAQASRNPIRALYAFPGDDEPAIGGFRLRRVSRGAFVEHVARACTELLGCGAKIEVFSGGYLEEKAGVYKIQIGNTQAGGPNKLETSFTAGPHLTNTIHHITADQNAALQALAKGQVDFILNPLGVAAGAREQLAKTAGVTTVQNASNGIFYLSFNLRKTPFSELAFRQAVQIMIDREFVCETRLKGSCEPAYSVVPTSNQAWVNPKFTNETFLVTLGKGLSEGKRAELAVQALKAGSFSWDQEPRFDATRITQVGRGLKFKNQPVSEIDLLCPTAGYDPLRATFCTHIEDRLQRLGIPLRHNQTGFNVIVSRVFEEQRFDMWVLGWGLTLFPDYLRDFFHSENTELRGHNPQGYSNPEFDKLADQFVAETDAAKAKVMADQLQELVVRDLPYVVLFNAPLLEAYRSERVKFPYTRVLDGIQGVNGMPSSVQLIK